MKNQSVLCTAAYIISGNSGERLLLIPCHGNTFLPKSVSMNPHPHRNMYVFRNNAQFPKAYSLLRTRV
jgi:hypothetical protein